MNKRSRVAALMAAAFGIVLIGQAQAGTLLINSFDLTTGGTASGSPANFGAGGGTAGPTGNENPGNLFDNNAGTKVLTFGSTTAGIGADITVANPVTYTYAFAGSTANIVRSYSLTSANDDNTRDPFNFFLEGSNDGTNFTIVDTVAAFNFVDQPGVGDNSNASDRFETAFFTVDTPAAYQQYRLRITETRSLTNTLTQVGELQLFTPVIVPEPASIGAFGLAGAGLLVRRRRRSA